MRQRWPDQINVRGLATITEAISCPSATLFSFSEVAAHRPAMGILMFDIGRVLTPLKVQVSSLPELRYSAHDLQKTAVIG